MVQGLTVSEISQLLDAARGAISMTPGGIDFDQGVLSFGLSGSDSDFDIATKKFCIELKTIKAAEQITTSTIGYEMESLNKKIQTQFAIRSTMNQPLPNKITLVIDGLTSKRVDFQDRFYTDFRHYFGDNMA